MAVPDFRSTNLGSIVLLRAESDAAVQWAYDNLALDGDLEPVINIEARMFLDIAMALLEAGLTLQDSTTGLMAELPATVH